MLTEEGYINLTASTPSYYYYLKDHQGNNRVVINSSGTVQETNHYYPFGGLFATNSSVQPYKYNGKEFDGKNNLNWYDYGARQYDATLGRWHVVDPMAEEYYNNTVYSYCSSSPLIKIDPMGMDEWEVDLYGYVIRRIKTIKHDAFFMVDKEHKRIDGASLSFEYGTIEDQKTMDFSAQTIDGKTITGKYDLYQIRGDANGTKLFEFLSNNTVETGVEWSHTMTGVEGDKGLNFLSTSHTPHIEVGISKTWTNQLGRGYTIREMNHSHPVSSKASNLDKKFKKTIVDYNTKMGYGIPTFSIYHIPKNKYLPY